jgi:hypothetical protein
MPSREEGRKVPGRDVRDRTAGMMSIWAMKSKLEWEIRGFEAEMAKQPLRVHQEQKDELYAPAYFAANACATAWHMVDWLAFHLDRSNAWDRAIEYFRYEDLKDFNSLVKMMRHISEMNACHQVVTAWKHVSLTRKNSVTEGFSTSVVFDIHHNERDDTFWLSIDVQVTLADEGDRRLPIAEVLRSVNHFWEAALFHLELPNLID